MILAVNNLAVPLAKLIVRVVVLILSGVRIPDAYSTPVQHGERGGRRPQPGRNTAYYDRNVGGLRNQRYKYLNFSQAIINLLQ